MGLADLKFPFIILASAVIVGGVGFHLIEGVDIGTSFYWAIVTLTTVGYGDIVPVTAAGRAFTAILMVVGIGAIFYAITVIGRNVVEGRVWKLLKGSGKEKEVSKMEGHIVVCGFGQIGQTVVEDLILGREKVVVVDNNRDLLLREAEELPYVVGDPIHEEVLETAGVARAKGLFATIPEDSRNILIVLNAKELNRDLRVVSRASDTESAKHLRRAGAEAVILPEKEGGLRMSRSFLHPEVTGFYDYLMKDSGGVGTVEVIENSKLSETTIRDSGIREKIGVSIAAIKRNNEIITNPQPDQNLQAGDLLIVLGGKEQIRNLKELASK